MAIPFQLVQGHNQRNMYKNTFLNMSIPLFVQSEPAPPLKNKVLCCKTMKYPHLVISMYCIISLLESLVYLTNWKLLLCFSTMIQNLLYGTEQK